MNNGQQSFLMELLLFTLHNRAWRKLLHQTRKT